MMMTMEAANGESDGSLKPISQHFIDKLSKEKPKNYYRRDFSR